MIQRHLHAGRTICLAFALAALGSFSLGCSDDETTTSSVTSTQRNPHLEIVKDGDASTPCFSIGNDPDARVPIEIEVSDMVIRPPAFCGSTSGCGHFVLLVGNVENNIGTTRLMDVLMRKLADRYGTFDITVEARGDDNEVLLDKSADVEIPARDGITILTAPACEDAEAP